MMAGLNALIPCLSPQQGVAVSDPGAERPAAHDIDVATAFVKIYSNSQGAYQEMRRIRLSLISLVHRGAARTGSTRLSEWRPVPEPGDKGRGPQVSSSSEKVRVLSTLMRMKCR
jgi:hypothetical protein